MKHKKAMLTLAVLALTSALIIPNIMSLFLVQSSESISTPLVDGSNWTTTEIVSTESTSNSQYLSLSVVVDGTVHLAWEDYTDYGGSGTDWDVFYKRYVPGIGWTTTEVVSTVILSNIDITSLRF